MFESFAKTVSSWRNNVVHPLCALNLDSSILLLTKQTSLVTWRGLEILPSEVSPVTVSQTVRASLGSTNTHE